MKFRTFGCLMSGVYWVCALFVSVAFVMGDCGADQACVDAKNRNYTFFWIIAAAIYVGVALVLWLLVRKHRSEFDE